MANKVVQTLCKHLFRSGYRVATMNFRGVGKSGGQHNSGIGEADDMIALARHLGADSDGLPIVLAGFSFGGGVQVRVSQFLGVRRILLAAPSIPDDAPPIDTEAHVLMAFNDEVVNPDRVLEWSRRNRATITLVPDAGHFFHGKLHVVANWVRQQAEHLS